MKRSTKLALVGLLVVGTDQAMHRTVLADGWFMGRRVAPFDPPWFTPEQMRRVDDMRHAGDEPSTLDSELGWCPIPETGDGLYHYDWAGGRIGSAPFPRKKTTGARRVVAVGCSYTHGDEVPGHDSWAARINARKGVELANLGVAGYGLDQAWMRWRRDGSSLSPDELWIGWLPAASLRIVNVYPPLLRHWTGLTAFKPRFRLGAGDELLFVPSPAQNPAEFVQLFDDPAQRLRVLNQTDSWVQRTRAAYAPAGTHPMHVSALGRVALTLYERRGRGIEHWVEDPASEVHHLLNALLRTAAAEANAAGVRLRLLVLPARTDLESARDGQKYWSGVCEHLAAQGVDVLDLTDALTAAGARTDDSFWAPGGHYTSKGHAVVASAVGASWLGD